MESKEAPFKSPLVQTPHDSQTLDEFKGIFAPSCVYSPLKICLEYEQSPVQRVLNPHPSNFDVYMLMTMPTTDTLNCSGGLKK